MMSRTHVPIGITAALIIGTISNNISISYILSAAVGSIIVDIDHPNSFINSKILAINNKGFKKICYFLLATALFYISLFYVNLRWVSYLIPICIIAGISKHRTITHSLMGASIMIFMVYNINKYVELNITIGFMIGYLMHILADYFTNDGVPIFYPIKKRYRFCNTIKTNSIIENIIGGSCYLVSMYFIVNWMF